MISWCGKRIKFGTQRGFTLIELMIVVAIIGILAAIAVPLMQSIQSRARTAKALADTRSMASALVQYSAFCGGFPAQLGDTCTLLGGGPVGSWAVGLTSQVTNPGGQQAGPFFNQIPVQPAGWVAYVVEFPAQAHAPVIGCPGATGTPAGPVGTFDVVTQALNGDIAANAWVVAPGC